MNVSSFLNTSGNLTTFNGIKIQSCKVKKMLPTEETIPATVVEFKYDSKQDLKALKAVGLLWEENHFCPPLLKILEELNQGRLRNVGYRLFAVTTQKNKFGKLNPDEILCLSMIKQHIDDSADIKYIESKSFLPSFKNEYKYAGTVMLDAYKRMFKSLSLFPVDDEVVKFYLKNGFQFLKNGICKMFWNK